MLCELMRKYLTFSSDSFRVYSFTFLFWIHRIWDISAAYAVSFVFYIRISIEMIFLSLCDVDSLLIFFFCSDLNDDTAFESCHMLELSEYILDWFFDDLIDDSFVFAFCSDFFSFSFDFVSYFCFDRRCQYFLIDECECEKFSLIWFSFDDFFDCLIDCFVLWNFYMSRNSMNVHSLVESL